jgi:hypothetical protein
MNIEKMILLIIYTIIKSAGQLPIAAQVPAILLLNNIDP